MIVACYDGKGALLHQGEAEWELFEDPIRIVTNYDVDPVEVTEVGMRRGERLMIWPANGKTGFIVKVVYGPGIKLLKAKERVNKGLSDSFAIDRNVTTQWRKGGQRIFNEHMAKQKQLA